MTELPTSPFPELPALDEARPVPSLGELLPGPALPAPGSPGAASFPAPQPLNVSRIPGAEPASQSSRSTPPDDHEGETLRETLAALMATDPAPAGSAAPPGETTGASPPAGTDAELADALRPLFASSLARAAVSTTMGLPSQLEPMLRNTVRRALAEQMEQSRQFRRIGTFDRLAWRLQALFTSRSYDDIVFDRTRRFQVEEAYLLRKDSNSLVSYASHDPSRHANPRRVQSTARLLASRLRAPDGSIEASFELPDHRTGLAREGDHCLLVAILRGRSNALVRADLDYVLHQAEDRFGSRLALRSEAFIQVLQPILEGCLLIQSPAPPR